MPKQDPWFFEERSTAFASLVLTARREVRIDQQPRHGEPGVDLLVEVLKNGKSSLRFFGVEIKAFMDLPAVAAIEERVRPQLVNYSADAVMPVCAFVIGVRKPEGVCQWLVEPVVEDGKALLKRNADPNWQPLDEAAIARMIDQVSAYYDAIKNGPPPRARERLTRA